MERIGIIDLGSNSARLVVVEMLGDGHFMVIDQLKESVRLGKDMERDGFLKPARIAETIKTIKMFRKLCDAYQIERIIAVATAAVRRAKNQRSFLEEVSANCGIKLRVLSAEEEATYVYRGVINTMDVPKGIILEIGGGSTKIVYYNRRNLLAYETLPFGSVTLTELFSGDGLSPKEQTEKIEEFFLEQLKQIEWLKDIDPETQFIGVGGSFRTVAKINKMIKKCPLSLIHNYTIEADDYTEIYEKIRSMELDKKKRIRGISSSRADILPAALATINAFMKYLNYSKFTVSACGLREGIMFNYAMPTTIEKPISDVLGYSLGILVKYYRCNQKHVEHVVNLSVQLFKQLRVLHKFPRQYLKILKVAATLHDAGETVKYYDYHKHSAYIILNSHLYGITHREIVLASFVCIAYKSDDFNMSDWAKYKEYITEDDLEAIRKLGIMLHIAESLDRSMSGSVSGLNCDVLGDSVIMKTEVDGDASLEIKDALNTSSDFKRIFKKNLEIL
ncbi:MAG: Ppx/GppA family phosphatase [Christensenellaceae bacterium]|nr:Ppx/GppA family phosphatase [Christensenellaceae bacterium]MDD6926635.1 Ppx/GppA phosphatase family protein [bacterium]MDY2851399.1 Ppx/GppA phosphatase family protein [Christensenellaceae bacterium]